MSSRSGPTVSRALAAKVESEEPLQRLSCAESPGNTEHSPNRLSRTRWRLEEVAVVAVEKYAWV